MPRALGGARPWAGAVVVVLLTGACTGDDAAPPEEEPAAETTSSAPPRSAAEKLGLEPGFGPTEQELEAAAKAVRRMSVPDLAGQVIVAQWRGTAAPVAMVRDLHLGGVIAFADNVASTDQVRRVNRTLRSRVKRRWPLWLSVDQEGGIVERVRGGTRFPAFMSAGAARDTDLTTRAWRASGGELRGLGFTVDFAPDADVTSGPGDPTIGSRSAGSDPGTVATQVLAAVQGLTAADVLPVVKHFPGHGSVPADSHVTLPVQKRRMGQLEKVDLVPFRAAVEAGVPAIMVGHLDVRALDPGVPTSLSRKAVTGLLREQMGYGGLVVTDSLSMAAVTRGRDPLRTPVRALRAGADVLLMPSAPAQARRAIVRAVRSGTLRKKRLQQAAARQIAVLRHVSANTRARKGKPPGSGRKASRALSAAALTVVSGPCRGRLVGDVVSPSGDPAAVTAFAAAARAVGLTVLLRRSPPPELTTAAPRPVRKKRERKRRYQRRVREWKKQERRRERKLEKWLAAEEARLATGTRIGFTGYGDPAVDGEVAVSTDTPYALGRVSAPVRVATYSDTPGAMQALVEVMVGRATATGQLPVPVGGVDRTGCPPAPG